MRRRGRVLTSGGWIWLVVVIGAVSGASPMPMLPPSLTGQPPMGSAPVSSLSGNPGFAADAMSKVQSAIQLLEVALPHIPLGSPPHDAVLNAIKALAKHAPSSEAVPGVQSSQLRDLQQRASQQEPFQALMRSLGSGGPDGGPGGGPGGPPMPGGGPGGPGGPPPMPGM